MYESAFISTVKFRLGRVRISSNSRDRESSRRAVKLVKCSIPASKTASSLVFAPAAYKNVPTSELPRESPAHTQIFSRSDPPAVKNVFSRFNFARSASSVSLGRRLDSESPERTSTPADNRALDFCVSSVMKRPGEVEAKFTSHLLVLSN